NSSSRTLFSPLLTSRLFILSPFFISHPPPPTEFYTLSLHDALPIFPIQAARRFRFVERAGEVVGKIGELARRIGKRSPVLDRPRSEEHTSELQSLAYLVCRLLLEKKKLSTPVTS